MTTRSARSAARCHSWSPRTHRLPRLRRRRAVALAARARRPRSVRKPTRGRPTMRPRPPPPSARPGAQVCELDGCRRWACACSRRRPLWPLHRPPRGRVRVRPAVRYLPALSGSGRVCAGRGRCGCHPVRGGASGAARLGSGWARFGGPCSYSTAGASPPCALAHAIGPTRPPFGGIISLT